MDNIVLTKSQEEAVSLIKEWYSKKEKLVFTLSGYAGTGKTFLINYITKELNLKDRDVAYIAPTGKACSVLIQKGRTNAMTIHRLIYTPVDEEYTTKLGDSNVKSHRIKFVKKSSIQDYKLIVVDEISMVDKDVLKDLLSYEIPILASGDIAQLPPINECNTLLNNPDFILTEIVRQAKDNAIISVANMARNKIYIPNGWYGNHDVLVINKKLLSSTSLSKLYLSSDQIICGLNSTRIRINNEIRKLKGINIYDNPYPLPNEKVICCVNNWDKYLDNDKQYNLVNGTIGTIITEKKPENMEFAIRQLSFLPDFLTNCSNEEYYYDSKIFSNDEWAFDMHQKIFCLLDGKFVLKQLLRKKELSQSDKEYTKIVRDYILTNKKTINEEQINRFEYAYAISCHKAQGSEWNNVVVIDESHAFNEPEKWLYTAITRAKKKLVIIQ